MRKNGPGRNGREQKPYSHQDWPAFFYGPDGESAKFDNPQEVPEGWHDSPDKVGDPNAKTTIPGLQESEAAASSRGNGGSLPEGLPTYDNITQEQIKERLDEEGIPYRRSDSKQDVYKLLHDHLLKKAADPDAGEGEGEDDEDEDA